MRAILVGLALLVVVGGGPSQAVDLEKVKLIEVGSGRYCKWSPDGKYLSFVSGQGLMIYEVSSGDVRSIAPRDQVIGIHDYNYDWSGPDELLFVRKQKADGGKRGLYQRDCISIKVDGTSETLYQETIEKPQYSRTKPRRLSNGQLMIARDEADPPRAFRQMMEKAALSVDAYYVISNRSAWFTHHWGMEVDSDVWLVRSDGQPYKRVTNGANYGLPVLSPDGKLIFCRIGRVVIDLDGNIVGQFDYMIDLSDWFSDSRYVVFLKTREAHDDVVASDIYVADISSVNEIQITDTPNKVELDAVVSPDMTKIAYRNYTHAGSFIEILDFGEVIR